jgi:hypothetical protein
VVVAPSNFDLHVRSWRDAMAGIFEKRRHQPRVDAEPPPSMESARVQKLVERINDAERRLEALGGHADKIIQLQARVAELEAEALSDEHLTELAKVMAALKLRRHGEAKKRLEAVLSDFTPDWRPWAA